MDRERHLLMVMNTALASGWTGPVSRLIDTAAGLREHGWATALLTAWSRRDRRIDDHFPGRVIRTPFAWRGQPPWMARPGLSRLFLYGDVLWGGAKAAGPEGGWATRAPAWYAGSSDYVRPDVVWAVVTTPRELPGAVAARNIAAKLDVPWVFELRDPCPHPGGRLTRLEERAFRSCLESCAAVVTTTQALADHLAQVYPCCAGKTHAIHHCYDDRQAPSPAPRAAGAPLRLLHAGTLYGDAAYQMGSLVRAIAQVRSDIPAAGDQIRLELLGTGRSAEPSLSLARELGIADAVVALPQVPVAEAVSAMDASDVLVTVMEPWRTMQIPGKIYHYMGRGKPILAIMAECEAADILCRSGLATVFSHEDVGGIAGHLHQLWKDRDRLPELYKPDWDYIRRFSRSAMAKRMDELLRSVRSS